MEIDKDTEKEIQDAMNSKVADNVAYWYVTGEVSEEERNTTKEEADRIEADEDERLVRNAEKNAPALMRSINAAIEGIGK